MRAKAKLYADKKRHVEYSDLVPGDRVLLKQEKQNKLSIHHLHQKRTTLLAGMAAAFLSSLLRVFS